MQSNASELPFKMQSNIILGRVLVRSIETQITIILASSHFHEGDVKFVDFDRSCI